MMTREEIDKHVEEVVFVYWTAGHIDDYCNQHGYKGSRKSRFAKEAFCIEHMKQELYKAYGITEGGQNG